VVLRPFPTSALPPYIHACSRPAGPPTKLHTLLPDLDLNPPPTPLVCATYVIEQPVFLSLHSIDLLLPDYSRFPSPYVSFRPGVCAFVVRCSLYRTCNSGCSC